MQQGENRRTFRSTRLLTDVVTPLRVDVDSDSSTQPWVGARRVLLEYTRVVALLLPPLAGKGGIQFSSKRLPTNGNAGPRNMPADENGSCMRPNGPRTATNGLRANGSPGKCEVPKNASKTRNGSVKNVCVNGSPRP
jgi:hypothetical protein